MGPFFEIENTFGHHDVAVLCRHPLFLWVFGPHTRLYIRSFMKITVLMAAGIPFIYLCVRLQSNGLNSWATACAGPNTEKHTLYRRQPSEVSIRMWEIKDCPLDELWGHRKSTRIHRRECSDERRRPAAKNKQSFGGCLHTDTANRGTAE